MLLDKKTRKVYSGFVLSEKMDKTVVVSIEELKKHVLYGKYMKRTRKFKIHDEKNQCKKGDLVRFVSCRKLSKDKNFRLLNIEKRGV